MINTSQEHALKMYFPIFLSVVLVIRNQASQISNIVEHVTDLLSRAVEDYEIIVIDNASDDNSIEVFESLTSKSGFPNVLVYSLTSEIDYDMASWVGIENSIGDFIAVIEPSVDDINFLQSMLETIVSGVDVVFAYNEYKEKQSTAHRLIKKSFNLVYLILSGVNLQKEAPRYRVLSRKVVNLISQHPSPAVTYRHLPATAGFKRRIIRYYAAASERSSKKLGERIDSNIRLLISTTQAPMRFVTSLCFLGAVGNLSYIVYILAIGVFKTNVAPGWISSSLQQSVMFVLISFVLLVLGEYVLQIAKATLEGPGYHIGEEFASETITHRQKLNVEEALLSRDVEAHVIKKQAQ